MTTLYALLGAVLFVIGVVSVFGASCSIRRVLAINIAGSGVFLILIALAKRNAEGPPDPVPHALVLTGIVVAVSATALALNLLRRIDVNTPKPGPADDEENA